MSSIRDKQIVGLGFQIGVGKDTVADMLVSQHGFVKMRFADALKEAVCAIYGWKREQMEDLDFKMAEDPFWRTTPREVLQRFGTEACRDIMRKDIWVKALQRRIQDSDQGKIVVPDVRFLNEIESVRKWGGHAIRITRPGWTPPGAKPNQLSHSSERELLYYEGWDYNIVNDGTLDILNIRVATIYDQIKARQLIGA